MEPGRKPKQRTTRPRRASRRASSVKVVRTENLLPSIRKSLGRLVVGYADVPARAVGVHRGRNNEEGTMTTAARAAARAAAPGRRLKGDVQATSIIGENHGIIGNWWRGRWGPRSTFTQWQLMSPWRRLACHVLPVLVGLLITGAVFALAVDRNDPRDIIHATTDPAVVVPGQIVSIVYTAKDKRECNGVVHRWIVDSGGALKKPKLYALPDASVFHNYTTNAPGVPFEFSREIRVPFNINWGTATYHATTERWCNPLQQYFWPISSSDYASFTVVPGGDKAVAVPNGSLQDRTN